MLSFTARVNVRLRIQCDTTHTHTPTCPSNTLCPFIHRVPHTCSTQSWVRAKRLSDLVSEQGHKRGHLSGSSMRTLPPPYNPLASVVATGGSGKWEQSLQQDCHATTGNRLRCKHTYRSTESIRVQVNSLENPQKARFAQLGDDSQSCQSFANRQVIKDANDEGNGWKQMLLAPLTNLSFSTRLPCLPHAAMAFDGCDEFEKHYERIRKKFGQ